MVVSASAITACASMTRVAVDRWRRGMAAGSTTHALLDGAPETGRELEVQLHDGYGADNPLGSLEDAQGPLGRLADERDAGGDLRRRLHDREGLAGHFPCLHEPEHRGDRKGAGILRAAVL